MADAPGQGKKLGFIAQEMGREINTTGSKSNQAEMQEDEGRAGADQGTGIERFIVHRSQFIVHSYERKNVNCQCSQRQW